MPDEQRDRRAREHVETWRCAGAELEKIRARELREIDTREAVRQLFGDNTLVQDAPRLQYSGLVEQQMWFTKWREKRREDDSPRP